MYVFLLVYIWWHIYIADVMIQCSTAQLILTHIAHFSFQTAIY